MDKPFHEKVMRIAGDKDVVFSIGTNAHFSHEDEVTRIRYCPAGSEVVEWKLKPLASLYEGNRPFLASDSEDWDDEYLPVLHAVESGIQREYQNRPELKDKQVIHVLARLVENPEMRLPGSLVRTIQDYLRLCLSMNNYSRKEVIGALRKVLKSVKRHHGIDGPRGYLDFIMGML